MYVVGKLLDIGAGDGNVTEKLATFVNEVVCTEVSAPMVRALNAKGFKYVLCISTNVTKTPTF